MQGQNGVGFAPQQQFVNSNNMQQQQQPQFVQPQFVQPQQQFVQPQQQFVQPQQQFVQPQQQQFQPQQPQFATPMGQQPQYAQPQQNGQPQPQFAQAAYPVAQPVGQQVAMPVGGVAQPAVGGCACCSCDTFSASIALMVILAIADVFNIVGFSSKFKGWYTWDDNPIFSSSDPTTVGWAGVTPPGGTDQEWGDINDAADVESGGKTACAMSVLGFLLGMVSIALLGFFYAYKKAPSRNVNLALILLVLLQGTFAIVGAVVYVQKFADYLTRTQNSYHVKATAASILAWICGVLCVIVSSVLCCNGRFRQPNVANVAGAGQPM
jgi:hypothetical protein